MKARRQSLQKSMKERLESVNMLIKSASSKKIKLNTFKENTFVEATRNNEQVNSKSSSDQPGLMKGKSLSTLRTVSTNFSTNSTDTDDLFDSLKVPQHVDVQSKTLQLSNRGKKWFSEFRRADPRHQIFKFFNDIAKEGGINVKYDEFQTQRVSPMLGPFDKASAFTVWRPTSYTAIRRMMTREAVGKGLDIKGKSAKTGKLVGFVPFLQIKEEKDKKEVRTISCNSKTRIFFESEQARSLVLERLDLVLDEMVSAVREAKLELQTDAHAEEKVTSLKWHMCDPSINKLDNYAPKFFGLEIPERLFWEGYVSRQDISRPKGSDYDSGRPSEPNFQDMNNESLRKAPTENHPQAVLVQWSADDPMCPQSLLMAYEEHNQVLPVVSDFDCFLTGTRGIKFDEPFAPEQQAVMDWSISQIEEILNDNKRKGNSWTKQWLDKLKASADSGHYPTCPELGFADPKSYSIMETGIKRLQSCSSPVRHCAESFNYGFPQALDEQFLVISDDLPDTSLSWKYVDINGLQEILLWKIDQGYTFPLNPKWILCDPGWKRIYDKLLSSDMPNVQESLDIWYPLPIREKIENTHQMWPEGFKCTRKSNMNRALMRLRCCIFMGVFSKHAVIEEEPDDSGNNLMADAEQELKRYTDLRRAKSKLRTSLHMNTPALCEEQ